MATTTEYLNQLVQEKNALANNLIEKGVNASTEETFTSLVPKVLDIETGGGGDVYITDASYLFYNSARLDVMEFLLAKCRNVTTTNYMFSGCSSLTSLDLSNFDTSMVTRMEGMFLNCFDLTSLNLSNFNTSNVTTMDGMYRNCSNLTKLDLSNFTSESIKNTSGMFYSCSKLQTLIINNSNMFKITSTDTFSNSAIARGTGYVYVPDDMVDTYKSATNWSAYADQIKGISELPVEGA